MISRRVFVVVAAALLVGLGFIAARTVGQDTPTQAVAAEGDGTEATSSPAPKYEPAIEGWENGPVVPLGLQDKNLNNPEALTPEEHDAIRQGYQDTNKLPVANYEGTEIVGFMRWDEYYGADGPGFGPDGSNDPSSATVSEVWSYDDENQLVGYSIASVGFMPIEAFADDDRPIEEIVVDLYGALQAEDQKAAEEFSEMLNDPERLKQFLAEAAERDEE